MTVKVRCKPRSSLIIEGEFELYDEAGQRIDLGDRSKIALCRCGASRERPFCDGSHNRVGFGAPEQTPGSEDG